MVTALNSPPFFGEEYPETSGGGGAVTLQCGKAFQKAPFTNPALQGGAVATN